MNPQRNSRTVVGGVLVLVGIALMLMNIGMIEHFHIWQFWPLILVIVGIAKMLQPDCNGDRWSGIWLVLLGCWFQMVTLHLFGLTYGNSWPALLIICGLSLTIRAVTGQPPMTCGKETCNGN